VNRDYGTEDCEDCETKFQRTSSRSRRCKRCSKEATRIRARIARLRKRRTAAPPKCGHCDQPLKKIGHGRRFHPNCYSKIRAQRIAAKRAEKRKGMRCELCLQPITNAKKNTKKYHTLCVQQRDRAAWRASRNAWNQQHRDERIQRRRAERAAKEAPAVQQAAG
jgi:hypothetical protein